MAIIMPLLVTRLLMPTLLENGRTWAWCLLLHPVMTLLSLLLTTPCRCLGPVRTLTQLVTWCRSLLRLVMTPLWPTWASACSRTVRTVLVRIRLTLSSFTRFAWVALALLEV